MVPIPNKIEVQDGLLFNSLEYDQVCYLFILLHVFTIDAEYIVVVNIKDNNITIHSCYDLWKCTAYMPYPHRDSVGRHISTW